MSKYKKIIIIGNGFDLGLGLLTSYGDFINGEPFRNIKDEENSLVKYLRNSYESGDWNGLEFELHRYSDNPEVQNNLELFKSEVEQVSGALTQYLEGRDVRYINTNSVAYESLQKLLPELHDTLVIDFNYTSTLEYILGNYEALKDLKNFKHIKIHGSLAQKNIILGVHDNVGDHKVKNIIRKSQKGNYNRVDVNLRGALTSVEELIIWGHSLGKTDEDYFLIPFGVYKSLVDRKISIKIYTENTDSFNAVRDRISEIVGSNQMAKFGNAVSIQDPIFT